MYFILRSTMKNVVIEKNLDLHTIFNEVRCKSLHSAQPAIFFREILAIEFWRMSAPSPLSTQF